MIYVAEILVLLLNVAMAWHHASLIKEGRPIKHGWWGLLYFAVAFPICFYYKSVLLFVCLYLIRKIFFDVSLNLFRELPTFYVSRTTTSLIDKLHNKVFGYSSEVYMFVYLIILTSLNLFL